MIVRVRAQLPVAEMGFLRPPANTGIPARMFPSCDQNYRRMIGERVLMATSTGKQTRGRPRTRWWD